MFIKDQIYQIKLILTFSPRFFSPLLFFFASPFLFPPSSSHFLKGEEQGFFGSKKYVQNMFIKDQIYQIKLMLNMDMISLDSSIIIETREVRKSQFLQFKSKLNKQLKWKTNEVK
jgi:hypothetical protein